MRRFNKNKAGYTAQDAPSMRTAHLKKKHGTDGPMDGPTDLQTYGPKDGWTDGETDTTSCRDATAHLKMTLAKFQVNRTSLVKRGGRK